MVWLQAVQAAQITFEDFFMADLNIAPLKIVGYEGVFGAIAMIVVMLPIVQFLPGQDGSGIHEDTIDTLHVGPGPPNCRQAALELGFLNSPALVQMIFTTRVILVLLIIQMVALLLYNFSGMCVTGASRT